MEVHRVGPPIVYRGALSLNIVENFGYLIEASLKGISLLLKESIDIIHSNTYTPVLAGHVCAMLFRKPHVATFHDVYLLKRDDFWQRWARQHSITKLTAFLGPTAEKFLLMLPFSAVHTVSETSRKDLLACKVRSPIVVIPNALNLEDYDYFINEGKTDQALYVGRLVFYKNLETVIKAFREVSAKVPTARLVIVGDGPYRKHLECAARDLSNVVFAGRVSHKEKVRLLKESSFLVLPSLVEGFGIVVLEAFACQKPALVSDVMPLPEIVDDCVDGFTIPAFDSDSWAERMLLLFQNPKEALRMGINGYEKVVKRYTIKRVADKFEKLYATLLRNTEKKRNTV